MVISSIRVGDFRMLAKSIDKIYMYVCQIRQCWLAIWPIPVGDLVNAGWQFCQYQLAFCQYRLAIWPIRRRYIFQDLGRFEVEIGGSKNMGGLKIMPRYWIKNKKNRFGYRSVPLINSKKRDLPLFKTYV